VTERDTTKAIPKCQTGISDTNVIFIKGIPIIHRDAVPKARPNWEPPMRMLMEKEYTEPGAGSA
jgi:hypothetical protein